MISSEVKPNFKVRKALAISLFLFIAAFLVFIHFHQNHLRSEMANEIKEYAKIVSNSLWTYERNSPNAYLSLAMRANGHQSITVVDDNEKVFLELEGYPRSKMDSFLSLVGLIPVISLTSAIEYEGSSIGNIDVKWPCRAVYLYMYIVLCIILLMVGIGLFLKLSESKELLEVRVRKRTLELEREIKEKKSAESELKAQTQRFSLHLKHTPVGVIEWNHELKVKEWNNAAERIFEYSRDEAMGESAFDLILPPKEKKYAQEIWNKLISSSGGTHAINTNHTKSGEEKLCEWYNTTLKNPDGSIIGVASLVLDITKQKLAEDKVQQYQDELEQMVQQRTEELTRTVQALKRRNFEADTMSRLGDLLQACEEDKESYAIISSLCEQVFSCHSGFLALYEEGTEVFKAKAVFGEFPNPEIEFESKDCWALRIGSTHMIHNSELNAVCGHIDKDELENRYGLCVPIGAKGELFGLLHLLWDTQGRSAENCELEFKNIESLAKRVTELYALSLSNIKLKAKLHRQSIRDALTGLYNRRYMESSLKREFARAQRKNTGVGVILFDVDHFKNFNDTYGHEAGDQVLRGLGKLLIQFTRSEDIATRYGGEELLLIITDCTPEILQRRAEEIRKSIQELPIQYNTETLKVTVSGGIACSPDNGTGPEAVVNAADKALYKAKEQGRNQIVLAAEENSINK